MDKELLDELAKLATVKSYINQLMNSSKIDRKQLSLLDAKGQFIEKQFILGCLKLGAVSEPEIDYASKLKEAKAKLKKPKEEVSE